MAGNQATADWLLLPGTGYIYEVLNTDNAYVEEAIVGTAATEIMLGEKRNKYGTDERER